MRSLFALMVFAAVLPFALSKQSDVLAPLKKDAVSASWSAQGASAFPGTAQVPASDVAGAKQAEQEIKKLIGELGDSDYKIRESATKRLTAIGFPALDALGDASGKGDAEIRARAADIVKSIHAANPLTTRVQGMEFKLVIDKEWLLPKVGRTTDIKIALEFKNTTDTVYRILLYGPVNAVFGNSNGMKLMEDSRIIVAGSAHPHVSPPLAKNETYTLPFGGVLSKTNEVRAAFSMITPFARSLDAKKFIVKGDYRFGFVYENTQQANDGGAPYWEGKAETPLATVTVSEKVEK
jgi:hypothetical protein